MPDNKPPFDPNQPAQPVTDSKPAFDPNQPFTPETAATTTSTPQNVPMKPFEDFLHPDQSVKDTDNLLDPSAFAKKAEEMISKAQPSTEAPLQYSNKPTKDQTAFDVLYEPLKPGESLKVDEANKPSAPVGKKVDPYEALLQSVYMKNGTDANIKNVKIDPRDIKDVPMNEWADYLSSKSRQATQDKVTQDYQQAVNDLNNINQKKADGTYVYSKEQASAIAETHLQPFVKKSAELDKHIQSLTKILQESNTGGHWEEDIDWDNTRDSNKAEFTKQLATLQQQYRENEANRVAIQKAFVNQAVKTRNDVAGLITQDPAKLLAMPNEQLLPMLTQQGVLEQGFGNAEYLRADKLLKTAPTGEDILGQNYLSKPASEVTVNKQSVTLPTSGLGGLAYLLMPDKFPKLNESVIQIQKETSQGLNSTLEYTSQLLDKEHQDLQKVEDKYKPQLDPLKKNLDQAAAELKANPRDLAAGQRYTALRDQYNGLIDQVKTESGSLYSTYNQHLEAYKKLSNVDKTFFGDLKRFEYEKAQMAKYGNFDHWYQAILPDLGHALNESLGTKLLDVPKGVSDVGAHVGLKLGLLSPDEELAIQLGNQTEREWDYRYLQPDIFKDSKFINMDKFGSTDNAADMHGALNWRVFYHNTISSTVGSLLLAAPVFFVPEEGLAGTLTDDLLADYIGHSGAHAISHGLAGTLAVGSGTILHQTPEEVAQGLELWKQGKLASSSIMNRALANEMEVNFTEALAFGHIYKPNPESLYQSLLAKKVITGTAGRLGLEEADKQFVNLTRNSWLHAAAMAGESAYGVSMKGVVENGIRDIIEWHYTKQNEKYGKHDKIENGNPVLDEYGNPVQEDNPEAFTLKNNLETVVNTVTSMYPIFFKDAILHGIRTSVMPKSYSVQAMASFEGAKNPEQYMAYAMDYLNNTKNLQKVFPDAVDRQTFMEQVQSTYKTLSQDYKEALPTISNLKNDNDKISYFNSYRAVKDFNTYLAAGGTTALTGKSEEVYNDHLKVIEELEKKAATSQRSRLFEPLTFANNEFNNTFLPSITAQLNSDKPVDLNVVPFLEANIKKWQQVKGFEGTIERAQEILKQVQARIKTDAEKNADLNKTHEQAGEENNAKGIVPIQHANGLTTDLEINKPYVVTSFNYRTESGAIIKKFPSLTVLHDNGDGSLSVSFQGEVSTIPKEDLNKYRFIPQTQVDEWNKNGDVRGLILKHYNGVFTYRFKNPTKDRGKEPKGRVRWDPSTNRAYFVYNDNRGVARQQELEAKDFSTKLKKVGVLQASENATRFYEFLDKLKSGVSMTSPADQQYYANNKEAIEAALTKQNTSQEQDEFDKQLSKVDLDKLSLQKSQREEAFRTFLEREGAKATKVYDKSIRGLNKSISKTTKLISTLKELIKKSYSKQGLENLRKALPFETAEGARIYDILVSTNNYIQELQTGIQPVQIEIAALERDRKSILDQLGMDYDEIINRDYESDTSLTEQVKEYRAALNEKLSLSTKLLDMIKEKIAGLTSVLQNLGNWANAILPKFATVSYIPEDEGLGIENSQQVFDEAKDQLSEYEKQAADLESSIEKLPGEVAKLDKVVRFLSAQEKKFNEARKVLKLQDAKDRLFKSQTSAQASSETGDPITEGAIAEETLGQSAKIEIQNLFKAGTSSTGYGPNGEILDPAVNRLQNFANTVQQPERFQLLLVTKDNAQELGLQDIIFSNDTITNKTDKEDDNDIRMVIVRQDGETIHFVDQNGKDLPSESVNSDSVVYSAMRLARLSWKDGAVNYVIKGAELPEVEELAEALRANHAEFRQAIIDSVKSGAKVALDLTGISRGFPNLTGNHTTVMGNLIPETTNLTTTQVIQLPLKDKPTSITGSVNFGGLHTAIPMPAGRPVLSFGQTFAFLNNKKFTSKDVTTLKKVFQALYETAKSSGGDLNPEIVKYLSKVLYWRVPTKYSQSTGQQQQSETIGRGQIWYSKEDGHLHMGNQNQSIPFSFEPSDSANLLELEAFLSELYHNVDNTGLMDPFTEILDIDRKDNLLVNEWPTYQAYLLSNKDPDGQLRATEDIPLKTTIQPSTSEIPNMKGRYLAYEDPQRHNDAVYNTYIQKAVSLNPPETPPVEMNTGVTTVTPAGKLTDLGRPALSTLVSNVGKTYRWVSTDPTSAETFFIDFSFGSKGGLFVKTHNVPNVSPQDLKTSLTNKYITGDKAIPHTVKIYEVRDADPEEAVTIQAPAKITPATPATPAKKGFSRKAAMAELVAETPKVDPETQALETPVVSGAIVEPEETLDVAQKKALEDLKKSSGSTVNDTEYRIATKRNYKQENLEEAREYFEQKYPGLDFHVVFGLIDGKAWGAVKDAAIHLSNLAEEGTKFHEEFEYIAKYFLNPAQLKALRTEFRNRAGGFIEYGTDKYVLHNKATDFQIKEQLAEEYRDYAMTDGKTILTGEPARNSFLRRVYEFVKGFIQDIIYGRQDSINDVFKKIRKAKYADRRPDLENTNLDPEYRIDEVKQKHVIFFHDTMRSMTGLMFEALRKDNISIPDFLTSKPDFTELYDRVKKLIDDFYGGDVVANLTKVFTKEQFMKQFSKTETYNDLRSTLSQPLKNSIDRTVLEKGLTTYEALSKIYDVLKNHAYISDNYRDFIEEHKQYLSKYGLEFTDDSELSEEEEEDQNFNEYTSNMLTRSAKLNANREVKLLIATLKEQEYVRQAQDKFGLTAKVDTQPKLNSLMMSQVVDYNKTIVALLYKMVKTTNFDEVAEALRGMVYVNPSYRPLLTKLKLGDKKEEDVPVENLTSFDVDLRNKFYTSMSNMLVQFHKILLDSENLMGANVNLNQARDFSVTKERWLSNIRLKSGLFHTNKGVIELDITKLGVPSVRDESTALKFLNSVGIDIPSNLKMFTTEERDKILSAARDLFKILYSTDPVDLLTENYLTREPLNTLAELYVQKTDSYNEPQHKNIENQTVQNIVLHNSVGMIVKSFNASKTLDEFYERYPQMNPANPGNGILQNSLIFKKGGLFFDADGKRQREISIDILDGSQVRDEPLGIATAHLNMVDRVAQEFSNNLEGLFHVFVPGDTKSEWGLGFGPLVSRSQALNSDYVLPIFMDYLKAEIQAVQDFLNGITASDTFLNNHNDGMKLGAQLRYFKGILRSIDPKYTLAISPTQTPDQIIEANKEYITSAMLKYLTDRVDTLYDYFDTEGVLVPYKEVNILEGGGVERIEDSSKMSIAFASKQFNTGGLSIEAAKQVIRYAEINYILGIIEQSKMIWGDPAMWKDMPKRTKSFTSGRMLSISGAPYFNQWHNLKSNNLGYMNSEGGMKSLQLEEGDFGYWKYDDMIRTQTMADIKVASSQFEAIKTSLENSTAADLYNKKYADLTEEEKTKVDKYLVTREMGAYEAMEESDAQAWAPFAGYREIRQRATSWGTAEEEQFQWDTALARWEISSGKDYETGKDLRIKQNLYPEGPKGNLLKERDESILVQGNPFLRRYQNNEALPVLNVLKPIQAGPKEGTYLVNNLDKMSTFLISWRVAKGRAMENWYVTHMKAGTTYIKVKSANKIGNTTDLPSFYTPEGTPNLDVNHYQLNFNTFGIQVETITQKDASTLGTQLTKQATLNLLSRGVPTDFKGTKDEWDALPQEEKLKSTYYRLSHMNNLLLGAMKDQAKRDLFKELGITTDYSNGEAQYTFADWTGLEAMIQRELNSRQAPENLKDAARLIDTIDENGNRVQRFALPFDLIIGGDKLESLFTSALDKRILRPKIHGGQLPQVSSTMFETNKRQAVYKSGEMWEKVEDLSALSDTEKESVRLTSNELKFYQLSEDGKKIEACEVMVPFYFTDLLQKGQVLSAKDIPLELRQGVGFRIPTQGVNAMENFIIKGFLPEEYGNCIVVPSEIVAKSGSDFDIDKLNVYLPNYTTTEEGKLKKIKYLDESTTVEERYEALTTESKFYKFLNSPKGYEYYKAVKDQASTKLISAIFGEDISDNRIDPLLSYDDNLALVKSKNLVPFEEFKKLSVPMQNSMEALENAYIDNLREILSLPENYSQLVEPNSAKVLKEQANAINRMYQKESSLKTLTNFIDRLKNADARHSFLVGKGGVGIAASAQSQHAAFQLVGLPLTLPYDSANRLFKFPTNHTIDGDMITYNLAELYSQDGRAISSVISAFISSLVDVNKDAFIIDINGNLATLGTYLTAVRFGIPIDIISRWFNQPIIRDYVIELQKSKSILAKAKGLDVKKNDLVRRLQSKYLALGAKLATDIEPTVRVSDYSLHELDSYIKEVDKVKTGELEKHSQEFQDAQLDLLSQFLSMENYQWDLFNLGQGLVDTSRTVTLDSIRLKNARIVKALSGPFANSLLRLYNETFQGNILIAKNEFLDALAPLYITELPSARRVLNPIMNDLFNAVMRTDIKEAEAKNIRRAFISYLVQTLPMSINGEPASVLTEFIKPLFLNKDGNITAQIRAAQEELEKAEEPNMFLHNLIANKINKADIRPIRKTGDKIDMDLMTSDFRNLQSGYDGLVTGLIRAAMLQSGVHVTPKSIQEFIPNELFAGIAQQVYDFLINPDSNADAALANFRNSYYENNWQNRNVVPKAQRFSTTGTDRYEGDVDDPNKLFLPNYNIRFFKFFVESTFPDSPGPMIARQAHSPYIYYQTIAKSEYGEPLYSRQEIEQMRRKGDFSYLERKLFKRLEVTRPDGVLDTPIFRRNYATRNGQGGYNSAEVRYVLFYPVDMKGDGMNLLEHYQGPHRSEVNPPALPSSKGGRILTDKDINYLLAQETHDDKPVTTKLFLNQHYTPQLKSANYSLSLQPITQPGLTFKLNLFKGVEDKAEEAPMLETENSPNGKPAIDRSNKDCA